MLSVLDNFWLTGKRQPASPGITFSLHPDPFISQRDTPCLCLWPRYVRHLIVQAFSSTTTHLYPDPSSLLPCSRRLHSTVLTLCLLSVMSPITLSSCVFISYSFMLSNIARWANALSSTSRMFDSVRAFIVIIVVVSHLPGCMQLVDSRCVSK
jgi:hypothetical protein